MQKSRRKVGVRYEQHGQTRNGHRNPLYSVWKEMRRRCHVPTSRCYPRYGGRGIKVCERWQASFADFLADIGPRPGPGYTLDRVDNDRNYEPSNVRWATRTTQARNSRNAKLTLEKARLIRSLHGAGGWKHCELAARFEIAESVIFSVIHGQLWKDDLPSPQGC